MMLLLLLGLFWALSASVCAEVCIEPLTTWVLVREAAVVVVLVVGSNMISEMKQMECQHTRASLVGKNEHCLL
jgi:hypothetical protein